MIVRLLAHTPLAEEVVATAGRTCYSPDTPTSIFKDATEGNLGIAHQLSVIHGSCFEHATYTFAIDGISRACANQLVRHRLASFSQQSQRYVNVKNTWDNMVIPDTVREVIKDEDELGDSRKDDHMFNAIEEYKHGLQMLIDEMGKHKIPSEDMRYFIPMGTMTNIVMTVNARELQHILGLRMCKRAQWEIREVAEKMCDEVRKATPVLAKTLNLGPQCAVLGYCPETKGCGRKPTLPVTPQ